jgi:hypothetical protein
MRRRSFCATPRGYPSQRVAVRLDRGGGVLRRKPHREEPEGEDGAKI